MFVLNKSVFSFLHQLTAWHCPHSSTTTAAVAARPSCPCNSQLVSPAYLTHSSKPTAAVARWDKQTDYACQLHSPAPHTIWAVPITFRFVQ